MISHQLFYHRFHALLARPKIARAIGSGFEYLPDELRSTLSNWKDIHSRLLRLLDSANPHSMLDFELQIANLQPHLQSSQATVARYRSCFEAAIEAQIAPTRVIVSLINDEVNSLLSAFDGGSLLSSGRVSPLLSLCQSLASQLSRLKNLQSLPGGL